MRLRSLFYFLTVILLPIVAINAAIGANDCAGYSETLNAHHRPATDQSFTQRGHLFNKDVEHASSPLFSSANSHGQNQHSRIKEHLPEQSLNGGHYLNTAHLTVFRRIYSGRIYPTLIHHLSKYPEHSFW